MAGRIRKYRRVEESQVGEPYHEETFLVRGYSPEKVDVRSTVKEGGSSKVGREEVSFKIPRSVTRLVEWPFRELVR